MAVELEGLEFQISDNSEQAAKGLNSLASALEKLKGVSKNTSSLSKIATSINKISEAISHVDASGADALAKVLDTLTRVQEIPASTSSRLKKIVDTVSGMSIDPSSADSLSRILSSMSSAREIPSNTASRLKEVSKAASSVGSSDAQNLENLAKATEHVAQASNLNINSSNISNSLAGRVPATENQEFERALGSMESATDLNGTSQAVQQTTQQFTQLQGVVEGTTQSASRLSGALSAITSAGGRLWNSIGPSIQRIGNGLKTASKHAASFVGEVAAMPVTVVKRMTSAFDRLFASMRRITFYRVVRALISGISSAFKEGVENMYQWAAVMDSSLKSSMDSLATSSLYLKNSLAAMASPLINALAPAFEYVTDKVVELFNAINMLFAKLTGQSTTTVAKRVATEYADVADSAGSAASSAKEALATILGFDEINRLNSDTSGSGGGGSGIGGTDYSNMFETVAVDSAISDFVDQLIDAFENGDWQRLGTILGEKVNEAIDSVNWSGIGQKIGYWINAAVQTAYWFLDTVDFTNLGNHLAELVNSGLAEIDFSTLGALPFKGLESIIDLIIGFLGGLDWSLIGTSVKDFIVGALTEIKTWFTEKDWADMGHNLYQSLKDFFTNLDLAECASTFWDTLTSAISAAIDFTGAFSSDLVDDITKGMTDIESAVAVFKLGLGAILALSGASIPLGIALLASGALDIAQQKAINWGGVESKVSEVIASIEEIVAKAFLFVGTVLTLTGHYALGIGLMLTGALTMGSSTSINWNSCENKIEQVIAAIEEVVSIAFLVIGAILTFTGVNLPFGIALLAAGVAMTVAQVMVNWDSMSDKIEKVINKIEQVVGPATLVIGALLCFSGVAIPLGLALMASGAALLVHSVSMNWGAITDKIKGILNNIGNAATTVWGKVKETAQKAWQSLKEKASEVIEFVAEVINNAKEWWQNVKKWWKEKAENLEAKVEGVAEEQKDWWSNVKTRLKNKVGTISSNFKGVMETNVSDWWSNVRTRLKDKVGTISSNFKGVMETNVSDWWSNLKTKLKNKVGTISSNFKGVMETNVSDWWSSLKTKLKNKVGTISSNFKGVMETASDWWTALKERLKNKIGTISSSFKGKMETETDWWTNLKEKLQNKVGTIKVKFQGIVDTVNDWWTSVRNGLKNKVGTVVANITGSAKAEGGIYSGGTWSSIPQYAGGTVNAHGSMFVAGEAGPELVGHVGGRTEVLNVSQLAAVMESSIVAGMTSFIPALTQQMAACANAITNGNLYCAGVTVSAINNMADRSSGNEDHESIADSIAKAITNQGGGNMTVQVVLDGRVVGETSVDYINGQYAQGLSPLNL